MKMPENHQKNAFWLNVSKNAQIRNIITRIATCNQSHNNTTVGAKHPVEKLFVENKEMNYRIARNLCGQNQ